MDIISLASGNSCWGGLDYFKNKKVKDLKKINKNEYTSIVKGTKDYNTKLNIKNPRKCTCDCLIANGKKIICKHIIATYFTAFPEEAVNFEKEQKELDESFEDEQDLLNNKVIEKLNKMTKDELVLELINMFNYGPEWLVEDFIRRNNIE